MISVVATPTFLRHAKRLSKKYPSLKSDLEELIGILENNPSFGIHIGQNCYKIRLVITSKGRGKSGGGRVVTCVRIEHESVFLLALFDKSEKETLADTELDELLSVAGLND
jgi:mRNA-degrading endonuclease RelE of RelBE toxin-antitoxin system